MKEFLFFQYKSAAGCCVQVFLTSMQFGINWNSEKPNGYTPASDGFVGSNKKVDWGAIVQLCRYMKCSLATYGACKKQGSF